MRYFLLYAFVLGSKEQSSFERFFFFKKKLKNSTIYLDERGGERSIGKGRGRV